MCGILCILEPSGRWRIAEAQEVNFRRRGPDSQGGCYVPEQSENKSNELTGVALMSGALLQLRGSAVASLPLIDSDGNVLCFNGAAYNKQMQRHTQYCQSV